MHSVVSMNAGDASMLTTLAADVPVWSHHLD